VPKAAVSRSQQGSDLFNHLVGAGEEGRRHFEADRSRSLEIDHKLELGWLLERQICRLVWARGFL
jgi:hypothetical protein